MLHAGCGRDDHDAAPLRARRRPTRRRRRAAGARRVAAGGGGVGISPLVVGLTVVAFGTSAPELAVSVQSALTGEADVALGNVVGSNIFNVLLILGLSALVAPLVVAQQLVRLDVPLMIGASVLLLVLALDGSGRAAGRAAALRRDRRYTVFLIRQSRREEAAAGSGQAAGAGLGSPGQRGPPRRQTGCRNGGLLGRLRGPPGDSVCSSSPARAGWSPARSRSRRRSGSASWSSG
jgi:hypothetical protein